MKVLIVFLAVLLLFVSTFVFQSDMTYYLGMENYLKKLAEECAVGACMYYDEAEYGKGRYILNEAEGDAFVCAMVEKAGDAISGQQGYLSYELELFDEEKGFSDGSARPSAQVTLTFTATDFFRLPFLRVNEIKRQGRYQIY